MRKVRKRYKKSSGLKNILISHIENNLKEYVVASLIFIIGILLGIVFFNSLDELQTMETSNYITDTINSLKINENIKEISIFKKTIQSNIILVVILWLMGSTVIGLLIVYGILCFKGFSFGYTVSAIIYGLGVGKGVIFSIMTMLLKNIISIPCTIALAVSGMKLYKAIMQDRRKENIKVEVIRHTLFCIFILILLIITAFIETYITKNILKYCINYI